jgi:hypothetical protein
MFAVAAAFTGEVYLHWIVMVKWPSTGSEDWGASQYRSFIAGMAR